MNDTFENTRDVTNVYQSLFDNIKQIVYAKESYLFDYVITCYEKEKQILQMSHDEEDQISLKDLLITTYQEYMHNSKYSSFFSLEDKLILEELERIVNHNYGNDDV